MSTTVRNPSAMYQEKGSKHGNLVNPFYLRVP